MGFLGDLINDASNPIGYTSSQIFGGSSDAGKAGQIAGFVSNPVMAIAGGQLANVLDPTAPPKAPGTNPALAAFQQEQQQNAKQFSQNLPSLQGQIAQMLTKQAKATTDAQVQQVKTTNNARGLTYSGINQGQQAGVVAQNQQQLGSAISGANANLANASNTLTAQAVETGVGIQQTQQSIQNQIYQQQLSQMQSNNSIFGSALGTGILLAAA